MYEGSMYYIVCSTYVHIHVDMDIVKHPGVDVVR